MNHHTLIPATDYELTKWRRLLLLRDSREILPGGPRLGVCAVCGDQVYYRLPQLQAHHIYPKSLYPERALDLDNGVMVCAGHHQGVVHNHNADTDVTEPERGLMAGWRHYVDHFQRWNSLAAAARFNTTHQPRLRVIR